MRYFLGLLKLGDGLDAESYEDGVKTGLSPFIDISNVFSITLDNCNTMLKLGRISIIKNHVNCAAHALQSAVKKALSHANVPKLLEKIKSIISELTAYHGRNALAQSQTEAERNIRRLFLPNATRWDSEFNAMKRVLEELASIDSTLTEIGKRDLLLTSQELDETTQLVKLLLPIRKISLGLQEKNCSMADL